MGTIESRLRLSHWLVRGVVSVNVVWAFAVGGLRFEGAAKGAVGLSASSSGALVVGVVVHGEDEGQDFFGSEVAA